MRARIFVCCLVLLAACTEAPAPAPGNTDNVADTERVAKGDPAEGARAARRVGCDGCHAEGGKGGGMDIRTPEGDRIVAPT